MNTSIEARIAALLADPLSAARAAAASGRRVIAYVGPDIPVELILAAGALPVRLAGRPEVATPHADGFVERAFVPEARSIAEQWVAGALDFVDSIVLPRSDDSAQRVYYYLCELQRRGLHGGPRPLIYDIAGIHRTSSADHTVAATVKLASELGAREDDLPRAIDEVAAHMNVLTRVSARQSSEPPILGSVALGLTRALQFCWSAEFRQDLQGHVDSLPSVAGTSAVRPTAARPRRILFAGNAPPDDRLHRAVESRGACVVRDLTEPSWSGDMPRAELPAPSFEAIGLRAHARRSLSQLVAHSAETIVNAARAARADAVILWMIEEDNTLGWTLPDQLAALKRAGLPTLALTRQQWAPGSDTLQAIENFCAGLGESR